MKPVFWEFIRTPSYESAIKDVLTADSERELVEKRLIADPKAGALLVGTGGFRKLRIAMSGRGKSSGARIVYYFVGARGRIYLVEFFAKNVKENLTMGERNALKRIARELSEER